MERELPTVECLLFLIWNTPWVSYKHSPITPPWLSHDSHVIDEKTATENFDDLFKVQFSSVTQLCLTLCNPINCSMPGLPIHHQLPESTQTHVHWVGDTIQPSHPLSSPSPPALDLSQHLGLFKWVSSSHQVAKISEFQLQHQSFQSAGRPC